MLGVIGRCEKERGLSVSEDILDQIKQLHSQVDGKALGDKAIDIGADLFPCFPDLAISLVEQSSWADGDENDLDLAYVRLSIATAVRHTNQRRVEDDLETIRKRIRNPTLRGFTSQLSRKNPVRRERLSPKRKALRQLLTDFTSLEGGQ